MMYRQVRRGVPVFSRIIKVHENESGDVVDVNGDYYPIPDNLAITPALSPRDAGRMARAPTCRGHWFAPRANPATGGLEADAAGAFWPTWQHSLLSSYS